MKLAQMEVFVAVADAGSMRTAARSLGMSQPVVSKTLRALERDLGSLLLRRTTRGVELTASGQAFLMRARNVAREIERARDELSQVATGRGGHVALGSAPGAAAVLMPNPIAQLSRHSPQVLVRIVEGMPHATLPRVRDGSFDFAIGPMPREPIPADLSATELFRIQMAIVVRKGHPQAAATSISSLADCDWMTAALSSERMIVDDMLRAAGRPPPRWRVQCESISGLIAIAARSDLVATIPKPLVTLGMASGLQIVKVRDATPGAMVYMFSKRESPLMPAAVRLAKLIKEEAKGVR
jgi:LysR family transcriptional regulator of abg operon